MNEKYSRETALTDRIAIAGAGSIGCFVGALLAAAGRPVTLVGRARILNDIRGNGARISDFAGLDQQVAASAFRLSETPDALLDADIICVAVKSGATAEIGASIAAHARAGALIVSLQNGISNAEALRAVVGGRTVIAGMVPYNVVQLGEGRFHRATGGAIMIGDAVAGLAARLAAPGLPVEESDDIEAVLWGKLVINLNNALNALAGVPLREELMNVAWRRLMADQIDEALRVLKAAGVRTRPALAVPTEQFARLLRLPNPFFQWIAGRSLKIDPKARSSMRDDLDAGRLTEIDALQGEIVRLGDRVGVETPIAERVMTLIRSAEAAGNGSPRLTAAEVRR